MAEPNSLEELSGLYEFRDEEETSEFLSRHPDLTPILVDGHKHVRKHFPNEPLLLSVEEDEEPEKEPVERLFLLIRVEGELTDFDRLERLDDEWSLEVSEATNELLVVDIDYYKDDDPGSGNWEEGDTDE
jgi:hypothetical protein